MTGGGNAHQSADDAVQQIGNREIAKAGVAVQRGGDPAADPGQKGIEQNQRHFFIQRQRTAAVKAKPAEPQQEHPQRRQRQVTALHRETARVIETSGARAEQQHRRQRDPSTDGMHHRGPGKVNKAQLRQPALRLTLHCAAPGPVTSNRVDQRRHRQRGQAIGEEAHPFRHRAGDDGGGGATEHELEDEKAHQPEGMAAIEQKAVTAKPAVLTFAEHQGIAEQPEHDPRQAQINHILDGDIDAVFGAHQPSFQTKETGLHDEYQKGAQQYPGDIQRVRHQQHSAIEAGGMLPELSALK